MTALILVLAANTAFNGFPVLGSVLAQHSYLPRQLHTRGDRLAFSNGILFLSAAALAAIIAFRAEVTALIQLYIVGVFISFTLSQIGMVRHWTRLLRTETDPPARRKMMRSRVVNTVGLLSTGAVLFVVLVTKFLAGAWIAIVAMSALFVIMKLIRKHYDTVNRELGAASRRTARRGAAQPQPRPGAGVEAASADAARAGLRARDPSRCARGRHGQRRRRGNPCAGARSGRKAISACR